jgi:hypothetical protein
LDRLNARGAADQARTVPVASRTGERWSTAKDERVLATLREPAVDIALELGRTWQAVGTRRKIRRRRIGADGREDVALLTEPDLPAAEPVVELRWTEVAVTGRRRRVRRETRG